MTAAVAERQDLQAVEEVRQPSAIVRAASPPSVMRLMDMVDRAIASGNIEVVGRMLDYQERFEAHQDRLERNEAVKAFNNALADAKAEIKPIVKNRRVKYDSTNGGVSVDYKHEDLAGISDQIDEILSRHGLFYRWRTVNDFATGMIAVTCIVSHRRGHSEENTLSAKVDVGAGKNHLQAIASAATYLERYTLKAALGLSAGVDDDGRAAGDPINPDPGRTPQRPAAEPAQPAAKITAEQAEELDLKLKAAKAKGADLAEVWAFAQADRITNVTVDRYPTILSALKSRYGV